MKRASFKGLGTTLEEGAAIGRSVSHAAILRANFRKGLRITCGDYNGRVILDMSPIDAFFDAPRSAFAAAIIAAVGWLAAYILNGVRKDRTRRLKLAIEHTAEQVRDFYAPLVSLTDKINSLAKVLDLILA